MKKSTLLLIGVLLGTIFVSGLLYAHPHLLPDGNPAVVDNVISEIKVFPNPSDGRFQLNFDYSGPESLKAKVFDITGKLVKDISDDLIRIENKVTANIDLENPGSGIYFIRIEYGKSLLTKKIIVR